MSDSSELISGTREVVRLMKSPTFGVKAFLDPFIIERLEDLTNSLEAAGTENARLQAQIDAVKAWLEPDTHDLTTLYRIFRHDAVEEAVTTSGN